LGVWGFGGLGVWEFRGDWGLEFGIGGLGFGVSGFRI